MNKSDLVEALSESEDLTRTKAEEVVDLVFSEMTNALAAGDRVEIRGLGSFKVKSCLVDGEVFVLRHMFFPIIIFAADRG